MILRAIYNHLKTRGHKLKLTHLRANYYPAIFSRTGGHNIIIEHPNHIEFRGGGPIEHLHKADPQLLPKIAQWWEQQPLEQLLQ